MPLTLQQATAGPHLHWRLLDTHRQVWASLLWGHCSFLLSSAAHRVLFVPSKNLPPQSRVSSVKEDPAQSKKKKSLIQGTSLMVQWLRLCAPNAGGLGSIPDQGTRPHLLQLTILCTSTKKNKIPCAATKTQCNQVNKCFLNSFTQKGCSQA